MGNYQLESEYTKYFQYKNNKTFHIEIKDSCEKLKKEELKNKLKKNEEIKNEREERLIRKDIEKHITEKKGKIIEEENI